MCLMPAANAKDTASKTCSELDLKVPRPMRGISTPFPSLMVRSSIFLTKWFEGLEEIEDLIIYKFIRQVYIQWISCHTMGPT